MTFFKTKDGSFTNLANVERVTIKDNKNGTATASLYGVGGNLISNITRDDEFDFRDFELAMTTTIVPVPPEDFMLVRLADDDDGGSSSFTVMHERPIIAFRVGNDQAAVPITIDGTNWSEADDRWAIRYPSGAVYEPNRLIQYRSIKDFISSVREEIAEGNRKKIRRAPSSGE